MKKIYIFAFCLLASTKAYASNDLLFFEAQGIAGYSFDRDKIIYHSAHEHDSMQKNSIGFDYIKKLSTEYSDIGMFALQTRIAYNAENDDPELQVYNAYYKGKTNYGDIWAGHNRIAFGLGSYWDTHGELMQSSAMYGFGMDRDWGLGYSKDTQNGNFSAAITTGSGMSLRTKGNWLATARASYGVLNYDNYTIGLSAMTGETLDTMGHKLMHKDPKTISLIGVDYALNHENIEHKIEANFGRKNSNTAYSMYYRISYGMMEENRLKLELQPTYTKKEELRDYSIATGLSYQATADLATRVMHEWIHNNDDHRIIAQLYYYLPI